MVTQTNQRPTPGVPSASDREASMSGLISGIVADVERLAEQQLALLRQEMKEEMRKALVAGQQFAVGAVVGLLAGIAAITAVSLGLWTAVAWLPLWAALRWWGLFWRSSAAS